MGTNSLTNIKGGILNVQSLGNKTLEIHELINDEKHDLLAVTETWLTEHDCAKIKRVTSLTHTFLLTQGREKEVGVWEFFLQTRFRKLKYTSHWSGIVLNICRLAVRLVGENVLLLLTIDRQK